MSSDDGEDERATKKRNVARACDICRAKKIRCDGPTMPGNRCSSCTTYGYSCTYLEAAKKRGPPKRYVESLENRVQKIERLLHTLAPDADISRLLSESATSTWNPPPELEDDDRAHLSLTENLQRLALNPPPETLFFGRSSSAMLMAVNSALKQDYEPEDARRHDEFWASHPSPEPANRPNYTMPPPDLAESLIDLYFLHINAQLPLLHRPTFDRNVAAGLHLSNDDIAATYLLVCALGSRFSSDQRVSLDGTNSPYSNGWRWFKQPRLTRDPLGPPPSVYELQAIVLAVLYIHGTSAPHASWTHISFGIRMAQDVGAHRRKDAAHQWTAEDELWTRAFWVLIYLDRLACSLYGRATSIQDEDFDLDFPIDCDDEYWEATDASGAFQQPVGKPSKISAFITTLRLFQILSFALRTIYSINKSKVILGLSKGTNSDWEQRIVVELDSALDKWINGLPDHLRWNPAQEDAEVFEQSAYVHCRYYYVKMVIHRAYIPSPKKTKSLSTFPSFAICLHAAKTCAHILEVRRKRVGTKPLPLLQMATFSSVLLLLLNMWASKTNVGALGLSTDPQQDMKEVQICLREIQDCEKTWHSSGRLYDILNDLAVGLLASSNPRPMATFVAKRERDGEQPKHGHPPEYDRDATGDARSDARQMGGRSQPSGPGDRSSSASSSRRLQASDVPAITTHFLPPPPPSSSLHGQSHDRYGLSPAPRVNDRSYPDVPLSTTSRRSDSHGYQPGPSDTPHSAVSSHRELYNLAPTHRDIRDPHVLHHASPATPLSGSSAHSPYGPPMHHQSNYSLSRESLDNPASGNGRRSQDYWYDRSANPPNSQSPSSQHSGSSTAVPFYDAFYDHVASSFSGQRLSRYRDDYSSANGYSSADSASYSQDRVGQVHAHPHAAVRPPPQDTMGSWSSGYGTQEWPR